MQKRLEKQKAYFVSPSTKELQRKPLGNLMFFFLHTLFLKTKRKPVKTSLASLIKSLENTVNGTVTLTF